MRHQQQYRFDRSLLVLLLSNAAAIFMAILGDWSLSSIMWVYWGQSVIIGFFNWKRMHALKDFSTANLKMNDRPVPETEKGKRSVANFFLLHYGFFHFGYLVFMLQDKQELSSYDIAGIAIIILVFLYNHRYSYHYNLERDASRKPNIGTMMFFPYARIIPMHLTIILGNKFAGDSMGGILLFLGLKTVADLIMHVVEHSMGHKKNKIK